MCTCFGQMAVLFAILDLHCTLVDELGEELRPGLRRFFRRLFSLVRVGLWTAGSREFACSFADRINCLLPAGAEFECKWDSRRCTPWSDVTRRWHGISGGALPVPVKRLRKIRHKFKLAR